MGTCAEIQAEKSGHAPPHGGRSTPAAAELAANECVHRTFERGAAEQPHAAALRFAGREMGYAELNARANQVAHFLRRRGAGPGGIVGLRISRSPEMIVGILGILKAGAAYLPIDPAYPAGRQEFLLADAGARWLLAESDSAPANLAPEIFRLSAEHDVFAGEPTENPPPVSGAGDAAYVIYTSGSTGRPKGVVVTHGNLSHSTAARFQYYPERPERFLLLSSCAFDSSVAGIFWTLCAGGALILPHEYAQQTALELTELVARHQISHLLCLPSLYAVLLDRASALQSLRAAIVAGETCPGALVERHYRLLPRTALYNEYGPTEATVWSTVHRCEPADLRSVPIGRAIPGATIHLLDASLQPVPDGEPGELCIGGPGVAHGYLHQPELTAEKFIADPFNPGSAARLYRTGDLARRRGDGAIEFLGRRDHQVKIRGHRIELEEIESALKQHPGVREAAVMVRELRTSPNGKADHGLLEQLAALEPRAAEALLAEMEREPERNGVLRDTREAQTRSLPEFDLSLAIRRPDFIRPPRPAQRLWLLDRALDEFTDDLLALDALARRFVAGAEADLATFVTDRTQAALGEQEILEDWHIPLMKAMARSVTETHGDILEIGFGRGVASTFLQEGGVRSHTIVECNESIIERFFRPWRERFADRDIRLVRGRWQDVIENLGGFDGIFFQTYPLNEREFAEYLARSVTFAEHFFPVAARHLNSGGAFTYLTHEIDSLSRRHQRLLFRHFKSVQLSVERLRLPADVRDLWWADSMVVARAVK